MPTKGVYIRISPSGKRYVGIAWGKGGIEDRWSRENRSALNPNSPDYKNKLSGAIRKYGANAFVNKILVITDDKEYMKSLERQLISAWQLKDDNYGYNISAGGDGGGAVGIIPWNKGVKNPYTKETIERMKESALNKPKVTEETKKKQSTAHKDKPQHNNTRIALLEANKGNSYALGYKHSKEAIDKMSQKKKEQWHSKNPLWGISKARCKTEAYDIQVSGKYIGRAYSIEEAITLRNLQESK